MHDANELLAYLANRDVPCPGCRYNLRGLREASCPECGQALTLAVNLADPATTTLLATVAGLSAGSSGGGAVILLILIIATMFGDWAPIRLWAVPVATLAIMGPLCIYLMIPVGRRRFRGLSRDKRLAAAFSAWTADAVAFAAMVGIITTM